MFDFVNKKKRVVQVIMGLAVLPFLFWGAESYNRGEDSNIAVVEGEEIQRREFEQAMRDQQDRMRSMLGENYDSSILDNPEVRASVLEQLIQQRLLRREAVNIGLTVLDSQLVGAISDIPEFQQDGNFSNQTYDDLLRAQGRKRLEFESGMRESILLQQLLDAYSENGFVPNKVVEKVKYLSEVQREVSLAQIEPDQFLSQIEPDSDAIQSYYDSYETEFHLPERVRVEYLVLTIDGLVKQQVVSDDEITQYFDEHQSEFDRSEEREASHILFQLSDAASEEEKATLRNKAEEVLEQVKQDPKQFAELAEQYSDDPGSATQGGDLGFFARGIMVKPFEDEIFQMEPEEIRGLVETDFGFHIIKLSLIKDAEIASLEEVKDQIAEELRKNKAGIMFGEVAEDFSNTVYEQSDTLQTAAEEFDLIVKESDWIDRNLEEPAILANERLLDEIFSDDAIKDGRNTAAIEVKQDTLISARILDHKNSTTQSLSVVKGEIIDNLKAQQAAEMAEEEGRDKLASLQQEGEEDSISWDEAKQVSYMQSEGLDSEILQAVFKVELTSFPTYTGIANPLGGYTLIRISQIIEPDTTEDNPEKDEMFSKQLQQMLTQEEMSAYLAGLRQRHDVTIFRQEGL